MTNTNRTKRLLKPLLSWHDDLVFAGQFLIVKPVEHLARGIILDRTSLRGFFHARWAIGEMLVVRDSPPLNFGEWVFEEMSPTGFFDLSEEAMSSQLCQQIEAVTLPRLRSIKTLADYLDFRTTYADRSRFMQPLPPTSPHYFQLLVAAGKFAAARTVRDANLASWVKTSWFSRPDAPEEGVTIRALSALLDAEDYGEIARQLRASEAITARQMKLEGVWRPTPFPFEATSLQDLA